MWDWLFPVSKKSDVPLVKAIFAYLAPPSPIEASSLEIPSRARNGMNMVIFGLSGSQVVALINELILLFNNIHEMK